jgi:hypothetical protein
MREREFTENIVYSKHQYLSFHISSFYEVVCSHQRCAAAYYALRFGGPRRREEKESILIGCFYAILGFGRGGDESDLTPGSKPLASKQRTFWTWTWTWTWTCTCCFTSFDILYLS